MWIAKDKILGAGLAVCGALALGIALRYNCERAHCERERE
jgi:hypothetical protein